MTSGNLFSALRAAFPANLEGVAIETAGASLRDLRVAEITKLDIRLDDDEIIEYRARVMISFKYDSAE